MNGKIPMPRWDHEKNEMIFGIVGAGGHFKYDFEFSVYVTFSEVPELRGLPAIPFIHTAISEVENVVQATEIEARRVGLLP